MIKKILIVVESLAVEESSGAKANLALIRNLATIGYDLKVLHYTRKEVELEGIETELIIENRTSLLFFLSRLERYFRLYLKLNLNSSIEKLFGFSFTFFNDSKSIVRSLKHNSFEPDLTITLSQGASFRPHHGILALPEYHKKWMAYIHDPYPMHSYPRPYDWVEPGHNEKRNFFVELSKTAVYAAFPSKILAEWMESYYKSFGNKSIVIPHQLNVEPGNTEKPDFLDPDRFNLLHAGNLLWGRDPKGLIDGFQNFLRKNPEAKKDATLLFVGGQNYYSEFLDREMQKNPNIFIRSKAVPFAQVLVMQQLSSVNVILEAKAHISPFLPGKFPHCIQAEKPILLLGPSVSESRRLLGEDYPFWSEIDDTVKIENLITSLYQRWKLEGGNVKMYRNDLKEYLSAGHLKQTIENLTI